MFVVLTAFDGNSLSLNVDNISGIRPFNDQFEIKMNNGDRHLVLAGSLHEFTKEINNILIKVKESE